ncbi:MAG: pectate lyase [Bacteroidales bacterium]
MKKYTVLALFTVLVAVMECSAQTTGDCAVLDTHLFRSSARHWYYIRERVNVINAIPGHPKHHGNELIEIGDNILLYQQDNGGWPKNYDMQAKLTEGQKDSLKKAKGMLETTFDNSSTYSHVECLARIYMATGIEKYKTACLKGLEYTLAAQYPSGGWPQIFPLKDDYSRYITYNDDVMIGIMKLFMEILNGNYCYTFINEEIREKIRRSYVKGLECILKCQISENGLLTAWAQQYDEKTLQPSPARAYEPVALCSRESAIIVNFLMEIKKPDRELINAVRAAANWMEQQKLTGIRIDTFEADQIIAYPSGVIKTDRMVVEDTQSPPVWSRFYELGTGKPLFCTRLGKIVYSLAEVDRERRVGYGWYTYLPQLTLDKYQSWQQQSLSSE